MATHPSERIVFRGHPSWLSLRGVYLRGLVLGLIVGVLAGLIAALLSGRVQTLWTVIGVLGGFAWCAGRGQLRRMRVTYAVSDRRVSVTRRGLVRRRVHEAWLEEIIGVRPHQTMYERMLGVGTVHVLCDEGTLTLRGVDDPRGVARTIDRAVDRAMRAGGEFAVRDERIPA